MYALTTYTAPTALPITLAEAKKQVELAVGITYHDDHLQQLIRAATAEAEIKTHRQIMSATLDLTIDRFPLGRGRINLPKPPLQSVTSITYIDSDGVSQTLAASVYKVLTAQEPGQVSLKYNQSWPSTYDEAESVTVRYVAGYADTPGELAESEELIKAGVLLLVQASWLREGATYERILRRANDIFEMYRPGDEFVVYSE